MGANGKAAVDSRTDCVDQVTSALRLRGRMRTLLPSIYFVVCFIAARFGRDSGLNPAACSLTVLFIATAATAHLLGRNLPAQNIFGLAVTIAFVSGAANLATALLGFPTVRPVMNRSFIELAGWTTPLLWMVALVNSRGMAALLLRRLPTANRGLCLIGLSSVLAASLNLAVGITAGDFVLQVLVGAILLVISTPWFLDKRNLPPVLSYQPLVILIALLLW